MIALIRHPILYKLSDTILNPILFVDGSEESLSVHTLLNQARMRYCVSGKENPPFDDAKKPFLLQA